jgi:hypothetical protein
MGLRRIPAATIFRARVHPLAFFMRGQAAIMPPPMRNGKMPSREG